MLWPQPIHVGVWNDCVSIIYLLKPTGYEMHHQINIQQLYVLPTLYLCVLCLSVEQTATCATYSIN